MKVVSRRCIVHLEFSSNNKQTKQNNLMFIFKYKHLVRILPII